MSLIWLCAVLAGSLALLLPAIAVEGGGLMTDGHLMVVNRSGGLWFAIFMALMLLGYIGFLRQREISKGVILWILTALWVPSAWVIAWMTGGPAHAKSKITYQMEVDEPAGAGIVIGVWLAFVLVCIVAAAYATTGGGRAMWILAPVLFPLALVALGVYLFGASVVEAGRQESNSYRPGGENNPIRIRLDD